MPLCKLYVRRYLTQGETLTFTREVGFTGPSAPVFSALPGARYRKALHDARQKLRALAEATP